MTLGIVDWKPLWGTGITLIMKRPVNRCCWSSDVTSITLPCFLFLPFRLFHSSSTNIAYIASIINAENRDTLDNLSFTAATGQDYDIRRKLNTASASNVTMLYGNNTTLSDVLNTYDERGKYAYVASNSLPSNNNTTATSIEYAYEISKEVNTTSISAGTVGIITDGFADGTYRTIKFSNPVPFIEGDKIFYKPDVAPLVGLETGAYYVSIVSSDKKQIKDLLTSLC